MRSVQSEAVGPKFPTYRRNVRGTLNVTESSDYSKDVGVYFSAPWKFLPAMIT